MKQRFALGVMLLVTMPMIAVGVLLVTNSLRVKELPNLGELPEFSLTERNGVAISKKELHQKVWVASFLFTSCGAQCPLIVAQLKRIQKSLRFKDKFRIVSITLDPLRDTPKTLTDYAQTIEADPYKWLFLTGENSEIQALAQKGFKLPSLNKEDEGGDIIHSSHFALVDGGGRIRGYYDSNEPERMKQLLKDAKQLIRGTY